MASWGEGAAQGIESGMRLAIGLHNQQRSEQQQDYAAARQATLDQRASEDHDYNRQRQIDADQQAQQDHTRAIAEHKDARELAALGALHGDIAAQLQGHADANTRPPDELLQRAEAVAKARDAKLNTASGMSYDPAALDKQAAVNMEALKKGDLTPFEKPGSFSQTITAVTKNPPSLYVRQNGQPAPMEQGGKDFEEGMQSGDQDRILQGVNVLYHTEINTGIGGPGAHGGTIVAKRAIHLTQNPNAPKDDPAVIPMLRVYVNNGKEEASGDEIRARRAMDPDAPPGATGYYDAPMTEGRSADPQADPNVKSISIQKTIENIHHHMDLVNLMNTPDVAALLAKDAQSGWDPDQAVRVRQAYGTRPQTESTKATPIGANGLYLQHTKGGKTTTEVLAGKPQANGTTAKDIATIQDQVDSGLLTQEQANALKLKRLTTAAEGTAGLAGEVGGLKAREYELKVRTQRFAEADKVADNAAAALKEFDAKKRTGSEKRDPATAARRGVLQKEYDDARKEAVSLRQAAITLDQPAPATTAVSPTAGPGGAAKGITKAERDALQPGDTYIAPDGKTHRVPGAAAPAAAASAAAPAAAPTPAPAPAPAASPPSAPAEEIPAPPDKLGYNGNSRAENPGYRKWNERYKQADYDRQEAAKHDDRKRRHEAAQAAVDKARGGTGTVAGRTGY